MAGAKSSLAQDVIVVILVNWASVGGSGGSGAKKYICKACREVDKGGRGVRVIGGEDCGETSDAAEGRGWEEEECSRTGVCGWRGEGF